MEFYEAINKRRTAREFLDKDVDFEIIKRILEAGNAAPTESVPEQNVANLDKQLHFGRWK